MEKRKHKRVHLFSIARFGKIKEESRRYFGNVVDVSNGGLFLLTNIPIEPGEKIWIEFKVNNKEVRLEGTIVRSKSVSHPSLTRYAKGGMGVFVDFMHPEVYQYIKTRLDDK